MEALTKNDNKPRLQSLDDMFGLDGTEDTIQTASQNTITSIEIDKLTSFKHHPFRLYEGERLEDMIASIVSNGVLVPIIVRRVGETMEILSGHNRTNAAKIAGLNKIPAIILEDVSDEDAMVYVIETNLLQRSFSDMTHTEKAAVLTLHHSKMFSQGKRNDILEQIKMLKKSHDCEENGTCSQVANKSKSITKVGQEYSLSKDTVARYLRIEKLTPELKAGLDISDFAFMTAVTLSYLKTEEQRLLNDCMMRTRLTVDMKKADMLRKFSEESKLDSESIYRILSGEVVPKTKHISTVKLSDTVYSKYFKPNQPAKEVESVVEKALELYFEKQKE